MNVGQNPGVILAKLKAALFPSDFIVNRRGVWIGCPQSGQYFPLLMLPQLRHFFLSDLLISIISPILF